MQKISVRHLNEAQVYLPPASELQLEEFAARQLQARRRLARLKSFYGENYCRMTRLHLLAACAIVLGRFCGVSRVFDEIGESLMPVDAENEPRTADWVNFAAAC